MERTMRELFWLSVLGSFVIGFENLNPAVRFIILVAAAGYATRICVMGGNFEDICGVVTAATLAALGGNLVYTAIFTSGIHNMAWEACLFYGVGLFLFVVLIGTQLRNSS